MKRIIFVLILAFVLCGCNAADQSINDEPSEFSSLQSDEAAITQTFSDWALGTEYGIDTINLDLEQKSILIEISDENYSKLEDYEIADIKTGIQDILDFYDLTGNFSIKFSGNDSSEMLDGEPINNMATTQENIDSDIVNLVFIHHSVGENWLNAGLNEMLNENNFHVADTYYGWGEMGDRTDTSDWPDWFTDSTMPLVYNELGNMTGYNSISAAPGENTIIMFKSCFPNSDVGKFIDDEKEIYLSLLNYFSMHPDKMFVLITPPPMQNISHPEKTRELVNWLVDKDGWRKDYAGSNLFVFDLYNVLTAEDNHHMIINGKEEHIINDSSNTLYYDSDGDDHPNYEGSDKAAKEFVPLLMYWYGIFSESQ